MIRRVKFKKLHPGARLPTKATEGSACWDIYALDRTAVRSWTSTFRTGLAVEVPAGYMLEIRPRSSMALKGITVVNSPGTIDSDYRGEILIILAHNGACMDLFWIEPGDRIAQIRLVELDDMKIVETSELSETPRGSGGLGSSGR